jgi:hypothetical protein
MVSATRVVAIIIMVCLFLLALARFPNTVLIIGGGLILLWIAAEVYMFWRDDWDGRW